MAEKFLALGSLFTAQALILIALSLVLIAYYRRNHQRYLKFWALSLLAMTLSQGSAALISYNYQLVQTSVTHNLLIYLKQLMHYLFISLLVLGTFEALKPNRVRRGMVLYVVTSCFLLAALLPLLYGFEQGAVFSRFYVGVSLPSFILGCGFIFLSSFLFTSGQLHFSARLLFNLSLLAGCRYLLFSFLSIMAVTEDWFRLLGQQLVYVDLVVYMLLGFVMLIWLHGAEQNAAETAINRVKYLGKHDSLTGALNREQVFQKLAKAIDGVSESQTQLAIYLIDIKQFKFVNDTYGISTGDLILGEIAKRLNDSILIPMLVGRLSGDSFVFAIEVHRESQYEQAIEHLHELISHPYRFNQQVIHLQCCIGYCHFPEHGDKAEDLLQKANLALFQAESQNLPSVQYKSGMQSRGRYLVAAEKEIKTAMQRKEFVLYFQPQLNLVTNKLDGAEALVRWLHPEKGLLPPSEFLSDIEQLGLSSEFDSYIVDLACQINAKWYQQFKRRISLAVNISAVEFQDPKLVSNIQAVLKKYDIPPVYLELEITENIVITDINMAMDTIVTLQNMGIKVSIDDFGTGYSSLAYLRELPIDKIKIDRSFINEFTQNDSDLTIVKSMIKLSHGLGKRVLAEGVETSEQLQLLRNLGCDAVQGYFVSKPISEEAFCKYFSRK
ncbi:putative bifunctional diguanylate cyclase/phosphodiesterase [Thalassotalea fusca]